MRKTSAKPKATRANRLPCSSPPMTIWMAAWVPALTRRAPSLERHAPRRRQHDPRVLRGLPARHHRVPVVEAALRRRREIVEAVDTGLAFELRKVVANLNRGRIGAEIAQRLRDQHRGSPAERGRDVGLDTRPLELGIELLLRLLDRGIELLQALVRRP